MIFIKENAALPQVEGALEEENLAFVVYDRVEPEPSLLLADQGTTLALETKCDIVVGVGGGSTLDIAKAIAILITNGGKALDYIGLDKISKPGLPKIMVPTTAGTGAELTFTAVFINEETNSKAGMNGQPLYPEVAILDPDLTRTLPPRQTAAPGIDAFVHALEAYTSAQANPISDIYALEAIKLISQNLATAFVNGADMEARSAMLLGSMLAGKALAIAGVGLVHAMAYPLGGAFGIPHGLANAVLLPFVVQYNHDYAQERYARVAKIMGYRKDEIGTAVFDLNNSVAIPNSLALLDITASSIPEMAKIALTVARPVANNPRKPTLEEVTELFHIAHKG